MEESMNADILFSAGPDEQHENERAFYDTLGLELGDVITANVLSIDLVEVQSRLLLIAGKFQKDKAPAHINAVINVILRVILEHQRRDRLRKYKVAD
jgi:hypothetical protein